MKEYVAAAPRTKNTKYRLNRLLLALGPDMTLGGINQETVNCLKVKLLPDAAPATVKRSIVTPLRAVLWYAKRQGWCDAPLFERLKDSDKKRTNYLLPQQATRLIMSANPALRVLIVFLLCTGARLAEALELDWRDVDLAGGRAIFWKTQNGKRRNARLPPRIVTVLRDLPHREGAVIRRPDGQPYTDLNREGGNQVHTAWRNARRHAGIDPKLRMHDLRHTWASWYYAVHRDLLELQVEGGWSSIVLVTRYAHLLPHGHEREIEAFWHGNDTAIQPTRLSA